MMLIPIAVVPAFAAASPAVNPGATLATPSSMVLPTMSRDFLYSGTAGGAGLPSGAPDFQSVSSGLETGLVNATLGSDEEPVWHSNGAPASLTGAINFCWWYHASKCNGANSVNPFGRDVRYDAAGDPGSVTLTQTAPSTYEFTSTQYFPLDGLGWNGSDSPVTPQTSLSCAGDPASPPTSHNFAFTQSIHARFTYQGTGAVSITHGDDAWVFVNGHLVIDLGGVHDPAAGSVTLNAAEAATLGLTVGQPYSLDIFTAQRHTCASTVDLAISNLDDLQGLPTVSVTGVSPSATYPADAVPVAQCSEINILGQQVTFSPDLSAPSGPGGTGAQTATCNVTDPDGTARAAVTYSIAAPIVAQSITFTSTPPAAPLIGGSYAVSATGGGSGNPVTLTADASGAACSVADNGNSTASVSFIASGSCVIDANQAAAAGYSAAAQQQQAFTIAIPTTMRPSIAMRAPSLVKVKTATSFSATSFSDPIPGATASSYHWAWGDGHTTDTSSATTAHTYTARGTYTVTLTVVDNHARTSLAVSRKYTLGYAPIAAISGSRTVHRNSAHTWRSTSTEKNTGGQIVKWAWKIGTRTYGGRNLVHKFSRIGRDKVTLTVTDNSGLRASRVITVRVVR
jgi:fibro-slime domain-containing protein